MRNCLKILLFLLSLLTSFVLYADNLDSLKKLIEKSSDTVKMRLTGEYGYEMRKTDPAQSVVIINQAIKMSEIYNDKKFNARLHFWLANIYLRLSDFDKGIAYFGLAEKKYRQINDSIGIINAFTGLGNAYGYKGDYNLSEQFALKAIDFSKKINYETGLAYNYGNLAIVYSDRGNYAKAIEYFHLSGQIYEKRGDVNELASAIMNMSVLYQQMRDDAKTEEYLRKALVMYKKLNDIKSQSLVYYNLSALYHNRKETGTASLYLDTSLVLAKKINYTFGLADCYTMKCDIAIAEFRFDDAIQYGLEALHLRQSIKDMFGLAVVYRKLGLAYREMKQYSLSEKMLEEAIVLLREQGLRNALYMTYYQMALTKVKLGKAEEGFRFLELYISIKDSCDNEESMRTITEMQTKYESQQKEKENKLLALDNELKQAENKRQKTAIVYMIAGLLVVLFFSVVLFRLLRQKQTANRILARQNIEISQQKEEIMTQRDEIAAQRDLATNQRDIIAHQQKDIKDSIRYAFQIQSALLPATDDFKGLLRDYFILYRPRDIVSGDFYWVTCVNDWLVVVVADCTGHGVPGAFMSMLGISFLNEIVREKEVSTAASVLNKLRAYIIDALKQTGDGSTQKDGMDMSLVAINTRTLKCSWAAANHVIYIKRESSELLEELKGDKMPVGVHIRMPDFTENEIQLGTKDRLYLFSDGFPDQFGGSKGRKYMYKAFKELIARTSFGDMREQKAAIEEELEGWICHEDKHYPQLDDITVMGICV